MNKICSVLIRIAEHLSQLWVRTGRVFLPMLYLYYYKCPRPPVPSPSQHHHQQYSIFKIKFWSLNVAYYLAFFCFFLLIFKCCILPRFFFCFFFHLFFTYIIKLAFRWFIFDLKHFNWVVKSIRLLPMIALPRKRSQIEDIYTSFV